VRRSALGPARHTHVAAAQSGQPASKQNRSSPLTCSSLQDGTYKATCSTASHSTPKKQKQQLHCIPQHPNEHCNMSTTRCIVHSTSKAAAHEPQWHLHTLQDHASVAQHSTTNMIKARSLVSYTRRWWLCLNRTWRSHLASPLEMN
jgi:hypothetical protein